MLNVIMCTDCVLEFSDRFFPGWFYVTAVAVAATQQQRSNVTKCCCSDREASRSESESERERTSTLLRYTGCEEKQWKTEYEARGRGGYGRIPPSRGRRIAVTSASSSSAKVKVGRDIYFHFQF